MCGMPTLPGKSLAQAHYDRVIAAFPGATAAEKAKAYDDWLTNRLIERVKQVEALRIEREADAARVDALTAMYASLPPSAEEPRLPSAPAAARS